MKIPKSLKNLGRLLVMLVAMLATWSTSAMAEGSGTQDDPYVLKDGGTYQETSSKYFYAKFTVPEDVTAADVHLVIDNLRSLRFYAYSDAGMTQELNLDDCFSGSNPWMLKMPIPQGTQAGTTYYFKTFSMMSNVLSVEYGSNAGQAKPAAIESIAPADGSTLSAANCHISFTFTQDVYVDGATVVAGDQTLFPTVNGQGRFFSIEPKDKLMELYQSGSLHAGDDITVTLKNVRAASGANTLGDIVLHYKAAQKPTMLTATANTPGNGLDAILSYLPTEYGNGMVQLQFDGDLLTENPNLKALIAYGNLESESDYYTEELPVKFFGSNMLAVDLRGKLRTPATMGIASGTVYDKMSLTIMGIKDAEGNFVYSEYSGSVGKFTFDYDYRLVNYSYEHEFTPAPGSSIDGVGSVELYLRENGSAHLAYTGASFAYTYGGKAGTVTVDAAQFDVAPDPEDDSALLIHIPVPEFSRDANTAVTLALAGLETPDGIDHSADFTVRYTTAGHTAAGMAVTSATMTTEDGGTVVDLLQQHRIEKLIAGSTLTIATSLDAAAGLMEYSLYDATDGEIIKSYYNTDQKNANGHWEFWVPLDYILYENHTYELRLEAWSTPQARNLGQPSIGSAAILLEGTSKGYEYSDVKLLSPAELYYNDGLANFSLQSAEDNRIQFTFSGPVTVTQAFVPLGLSPSQYCTVEMSADGCTADIVIPAEVLNNYSQFTVNLLAKDSEGRVVKGNNGEGNESYIAVYVDAKFNQPLPILVSPSENEAVKAINSLRFSYPKGIQASWFTGPITIYGKAREVVASSTDVVSIIPDEERDNWDYIVTEVEVVLDKAVTKSGSYIIEVPEGFFSLDLENQGFNVKSSRECFFNVEVEGEDEPILTELDCTVDPEPGKVAALSAFNITFNDFETCNWTYDIYPVFTDNTGKPVTVQALEYGDNWDLLNQLKCTLPETYTTAGIYTLTIPAGAVTYNDDPDKTNPVAVSFEYTIGSGDGIATLLGGTAKAFDVYTTDGRRIRRGAKAENLQSLPAGAYIINGRNVLVR